MLGGGGMLFHWIAAALMILVALYHSYRGHKSVVAPLLALDTPLMQNPQMRKVIPVAWHMASYFMAAFAAVIVWPNTPAGLILVVGGVWAAMGLYIFVRWRGAHKGGYLVMAAGAFSLLAVFLEISNQG